MKIDSAQIMLGSQHHFARQKSSQEELIVGTAQAGKNWSEENLQQGLIYKREQVTNQLSMSSTLAFPLTRPLTNNLSNLPQQPASPAVPANYATAHTQFDKNCTEATIEPHLQVLIRMIEILTGKKIQLHEIDIPQEHPAQDPAAPINHPAMQQTISPDENWGLRYHFEETIRESEFTSFTAQGVIRTSDGQEMVLEIELNMSREFVQQEQIDITAGAARLKDPLVINFEGHAALLGQQQFSFDLDADGKNENISQLAGSSGLLALDKNSDGKINNGSELFGALSGDGFAELAQYDHDNNGFIDEADSIFSKLKVWLHTENGESKLMGLIQANVGAIYLGHIETTFDLKDQQNNLQARIRDSGIFIAEDGNVGTVQQLDMVV